MSSRPRAAARLGALGLLIVAFLALAASPAAAEYRHTITTGEFGKEGPKATGLGNGCNIAYQSANHILYLFADGKIYGLNRTAPGVVSPLGGGFPITTGLNSSCGDRHMTVDNTAGATAGNVYAVPSNTNIYGWGPTGAPNPPWTAGVNAGGETCGVAVTNTGEVWGGTYGGGKITKFSSGGSALPPLSPGLASNCKIAIDQSNNDLYVVRYSGGTVRKLSAASSYVPSLEFPGGSGNASVAINGAKKRLYVPTGSTIKVYDTTTAALIETISIPGSTSALAVDEATDTLFVADTSKGFIREIPGANVPKPTTGEPTGNTAVSGTADPDGAGNITECYFEFGTTTNYGTTQPCEQATPYAGVTAVGAVLPGLAGETLYHYRLVLGNANLGGRSFGADKTITPHNVKGLLTEEATAVTRTSAELHGSFEGNGEETKYYFEWGQTTAYGTQSAIPPGTSAGSPTYPPRTFLSFSPSGLLPATLYHFRVVAENGKGKSPGADRTFTTPPAVQSLTTEAATNLAPKAATLNGSYVGDGDSTTYYFEYGKTTSYGTNTTVTSAGNPSGPTPLPANISGLELETLYHYRVVATNSLGTTKAADMTFTTNPAVAGVLTKAATGISQKSVVLNGQFTGNGEDTHYFFEYGLTTKYGHKTAVPPGDDAGPPVGVTPVSTEITDYEAYSTYHYRIVTSNSEGTTVGKDMTFETLPAPLPAISGTAASGVSPTGATMEAEINPNRWATVFLFQYGNTTEYGESTEISGPIGSDQFVHPVGATATNLSPGTAYHFRAVAINFTGTQYGPDRVLTTPDAPRVDLTSFSALGETSAHLGGKVSPNSSATTVHFEYGTSTAYGQSTAGVPIGSDAADHEVGADLSGLAAVTTYHFRIVASNTYGTTMGPDQTFATLPASARREEKVGPCKKGFVRRHGKCGKKRQRHRRHSTRRHG